jgi:hypothetical protein
MDNSVILKLKRGGCGLSVLDRGKERQKERCSSNTRRAEKGTKNRGEEKS